MTTSSRAHGRTVNVAQLIALFLAFLMVSGLGGVLASGLVMPGVAAAGSMVRAGTQLFDDLPTELGQETMSERSTILARDGSELATFYSEDRIVVPLEEMSPYLREAVVAVEDERFYEHGGIDPQGLMRAVVTNLTTDATQGASTLTQQYVKNVLMEAARRSNDPVAFEEARETSIGRKLREAKLAIALEQQRTKDEILEGYLNIAQFGPSQYGVEAASQYFYSSTAADLTLAQAALLAGITQSPGRWNPVVNPENAQNRRDTVLSLMLAQDRITREEHDEAVGTAIEDMLDVSPLPPTCSTAGSAAYFCDYVVATILNATEFGETREARRQLLLRGGLTIQTTLDPRLQREATQSLMDAVPPNDAAGVSTAISTVQPGTGQILAMAQNTAYGSPDADNLRTTSVNFNADSNYGGASGFQTGSTFKAIILAAWLESGNNLMQRVDASQGQTFARSSWNYSCADLAPYADNYEPRNIEGIGSGQMSVLDVTKESVNTAYVNMANQLDMCQVYDVATRLGIHVGTSSNTWVNPSTGEDTGLAINPGPSLVLGANNLAPLTMASAFAAFAADGVHCKPIAILEVLDSDGEPIAVPGADCQQAISAEVARTVTYALQDVVSPGGTGVGARLGERPVAGKTGTANNNTAAWFIGYVPQMATALWTGYSEELKSMNGQTINGQWYRLVYGGNFAVPIWHDYMSSAVEGMDVQQFSGPNDRLVYGERRNVPNVGGLSVSDATAQLQAQGFGVSVGSAREHESVPEGDVIGTSPGSGSYVPQGSVVTLIPSSGPPPEPEPEPEPDDQDNGGGNGDRGNRSEDDD